MKPPSLLTRLQSVFSVLRRRPRPRPGRKPPPRRLELEGLEDRSVTGGGILETYIATVDPSFEPSLPDEAAPAVAPEPIQIVDTILTTYSVDGADTADAPTDRDGRPASEPVPRREGTSDDQPTPQNRSELERDNPFPPDAIPDDQLDDPFAVLAVEGSSIAAPAPLPSGQESAGLTGSGSDGPNSAGGTGAATGGQSGGTAPLAATPAGQDALPLLLPPSPAAGDAAPAVPATLPPAAVTPIPDNPAASGHHHSITPIDPNIIATEGTAFSGTVAQFTDNDGNTNPGFYTTTINWGDGTGSTPGTVSYAGNHVFSVSGSHTFTEEGTRTVVTTIRDLDTQSWTINSPATVSDAALVPAAALSNLTLQLSKGVAFSGTVGGFQDQDPQGVQSDYTASINWGDGRTSAGTVTLGPGYFQVNGSHTYAEAGTYTIRVTSTDAGGASITTRATASVANSNLSASPASPSLTEQASSTVTVATFTDNDGNTNAGAYTASITWGDGQTSPAP